jgi:hypothetical protein
MQTRWYNNNPLFIFLAEEQGFDWFETYVNKLSPINTSGTLQFQ